MDGSGGKESVDGSRKDGWGGRTGSPAAAPRKGKAAPKTTCHLMGPDVILSGIIEKSGGESNGTISHFSGGGR